MGKGIDVGKGWIRWEGFDWGWGGEGRIGKGVIWNGEGGCGVKRVVDWKGQGNWGRRMSGYTISSPVSPWLR